MDLFGFIFPKRCVSCKKPGSYLCETCFTYLSFDTKSLCLVCGRRSSTGLTHARCKRKYTIDGCFSAISYNKTTKILINDFKYRPFLSDLRHLLSDLFYESLIQKEEFINQLKKGNFEIVPIPLSSSNFRKRGYNQSEILAFELSKKLGIPERGVLRRIRETDTKIKLTKKEKGWNMKDAFITKESTIVENKNILLVDDVLISGANFLEVANILKKNGAKRVIGLSLARG